MLFAAFLKFDRYFHMFRPKFTVEGALFMSAATLIFFAFFCYLKRVRSLTWIETFGATSLAAYLVFVYRFTVFMRRTKEYMEICPVFGYSYYRIVRHGKLNFFWGNIFNVAIFVPLGAAFALAFGNRVKWTAALGFGFMASLGIELLQLSLRKGICEFDDLYHNTLGFAIGYFIFRGIARLARKKEPFSERLIEQEDGQ